MERKTKVLEVNDLRRDRPALDEAAAMLQSGEVVVFATETVYGLGADATNPQAVAAIFEAKGRPQDNPLIVHISRMEALEELVREVPPAARRLADRFWPGPLTMILRRSERIPKVVSAGLDTVAVRMPSHPVARALIDLSGVPVAAPSANLSGSPSPTTAAHCLSDLNGRVGLILDSGSCHVGIESTVVSLVTDPPRLLRPGMVTPEQLREVLGELQVDEAVTHEVPSGEAVASPGMKYRHYAPQARLWLVHGNLQDYIALLHEKRGCGVWALAFEDDRPSINYPCLTYGSEGDAQSQAEHLFAALRELDRRGARFIYARAPEPSGMGLAVYNRLLRAAAFDEIYLDSQ